MANTEKHTVHFSLGANAGIMLQNIAYEHLFCEMEPQKAWDALVLSGCPEQYVAPILRSQLFLYVIDGGTMGICSKDELPEGDYEEYHKFDPHFLHHTVHKEGFDLIDQGEYLQKHLYQFFSNGLLYDLDIDHAEAIFDLPKGWHWSVGARFTPMDLARIWMTNDYQMQQIIESGELTRCFSQQVSDIFNDLEGVRRFVNEGLKLIRVREWMMENLACSGECEGFTHYMAIVADLAKLLSVMKELDEDGLKEWNATHKYLEKVTADYSASRLCDDIAGATVFDELDRFVTLRKELDKRDISEPVQFDHNWTAGFIDRDGNVLAMDGEESRLAHIDIADAVFENWPSMAKSKNVENRDWHLDKMGWVRFHEGRVRYSGYNLVSMGSAMRDLPFTQKQRDRLAEYTEKFYPYGIHNEGLGNNHTMITADMWRNDPDEKFRDIFDM